MQGSILLRWCDRLIPFNWAEGEPRQISNLPRDTLLSEGLVCAQTGPGYNLCVVPTLTFCPCISDGWMDRGSGGVRGRVADCN